MKKLILTLLFFFYTTTGFAAISGSPNLTPGDSVSNPSSSVGTFSLTGIWNGSIWLRWRAWNNADGFSVASSPSVISAPLLYNGTLYDRWRSGVNIGQALTDSSSNASTNLVANATTAIKATGGVLNGVIINTAGTTSTVAFYNVASGSCTGTPGAGYAFTLSTAAITPFPLNINHTFTNGICAVTAGGAAANISILYR